MAEEIQETGTEEYQPTSLANTVNMLVDGYNSKTGLFGKKGPYFNKSAYEVQQMFKATMAQKGKTPVGVAVMEAFGDISARENPPSIIDQIADTTVDQFHGVSTAIRESAQGLMDVAEGASKAVIQMNGNLFPFNLLRRGKIEVTESGVRYDDIEKTASNVVDEKILQQIKPHSPINVTDENVQYIKMWEGPKPKTTAGQIAQGVTQGALSYAIGDKVFAPAKALQKMLPKFRNVISTPAFKGVVNTAFGEAATLQGKDRFSTFLRENLGVNNTVINYLSESKDENEFERRLKSGLDGVVVATGFGALIPVLVPLGKALYKNGYFGSKLNDVKGGQEEINKAESILKKIEELYPQRIVKTKTSDDPLVSIKTKAQKTAEESTEEVVEEQTEGADVLTRPDETAVKKGKKGKKLQKPAPIQPDDITREDLDIYKNRKDVPLDSALADFNMERVDAEESILQVIQRGAEKLNEKLANSPYYGPSGKATKGDDDVWRTEGDNVITFEDIQESAANADELLKRNGISKERLFAGLKASTQELPSLVLVARDFVVTMGKKVRDEARLLQELTENGQTPTDEQLAKFHRSMVRFMNNLAEVKGIKRDIARTLAAMNIDAVTGQERKDLVDSIILDAGSTNLGDMISDMTTKSKATDGRSNLLRLVTHVAEMEYADQLLNVVNKDRVTRIFDLINYVGVNSYLANLSTQTVNLAGSLALTNILTAEKFIAAGFNKLPLIKGPDGVTFDEATAHSFGAFQALAEILFHDKAIFDRSALGEARKGFMDLESGFSNYDIKASNQATKEKVFQYPDLEWQGMNVPEAFSSESVEQIIGMDKGTMPQFMKELVNGLGVTLGAPGRLLMGGDRFFRAINYRSAIHSLAMRKAVSEGLTGTELQQRYADIIKNLPEEIDNAAQMYAQVALFQEDLSKEGVESFFKALEKARNAPIPTVEREWVHSLAANGLSSFLNQKIPFLRTPYNIFKQTVVNRGAGALIRLAGPKYRARFKNDAAFRQDVLAKVTTGGILQGLGYTFGRKVIFRNDKDEPTTSVQITGGADPTPLGRDIAQDQMRMQPEILIRNMETSDAITIPIGRADPLASLIQMGSIFGNAHDYWDTHVQPFRDKKHYDASHEKIKELGSRFLFQLGNFFLDKAMLRGVKEVVDNVGMSPQSDMTRLITDYFTQYMVPFSPPLGNFPRGTKKAVENVRYYDEGKVRGRVVDRDPENVNISDSGLLSGYADLSPQKQEELNALYRTFNRWITEWRKVNIIDMEEGEPDIKGMITGKVKMKAGAIPMVDLEGNPMGFTDKEKDMYNRWLDQNLIPFTAKKVNETNTSVLISELDISTIHPKRWTHIAVKGRKIPLTSEQQMVWAALYGYQNRKLFSRYNKEVKLLKLKGAKGMDLKKALVLKDIVEEGLEKNKEVSKNLMLNKFTNMKQKTGLRLFEQQLRIRAN